MIYEKPRMVVLGVEQAQGANCNDGSVASDWCSLGVTATGGNCNTGISATGNCTSYGGTADTG